MKFTLATATLLLAAIATAMPQNRNGNSNGNSNNGVSSNSNSNNGQNSNGNSNSNSNGQNTNGNTNGNSNGNSNSNSNTGNTNSGSNNGGNNNGGNSNGNNSTGQVSQAQAQLMQTAIDAWMRDTGVVSNFLNIGKNLNDEQTFKNQALIAHSAEVDELTHKAVLDQYMPNNNNVKSANGTLSNGAFQLVVDRLEDMATQGRSQVNGIDDINNDRCVNVLPNIDAYMREAALTIGGQSTQQSVRPAACSNITPGQNGAAQVGQAPQGYVNGKLQGRKVQSNTNPNIPTTPDGDQPK